jgi:hypothetical protein
MSVLGATLRLLPDKHVVARAEERVVGHRSGAGLQQSGVSRCVETPRGGPLACRRSRYAARLRRSMSVRRVPCRSTSSTT